MSQKEENVNEGDVVTSLNSSIVVGGNSDTTYVNAPATPTISGNGAVGSGSSSLKSTPNDLLLNLRKYTNKLLEINGIHVLNQPPSGTTPSSSQLSNKDTEVISQIHDNTLESISWKISAAANTSAESPTLNQQTLVVDNNHHLREHTLKTFKTPKKELSEYTKLKKSESMVLVDQLSDIGGDLNEVHVSKSILNYREIEVKKCYDIIFKLRSKLVKEKEKNEMQERRKEDSTKMLGKLMEHYKSENSRLIQQLDFLRRDSDSQIEEQLHQMNELRVVNFSLMEEITLLRNSVNTEKQKGDQDIERHIREKSKTQSDLIECKRENSKLRETVIILEETVKKLEVEVSESVKNYEEVEIPSLKKKCSQYEKTNSDLEKKMDDIRKESERIVNQYAERFKSKEVLLGETIKRLGEDLKKQRDTSKRNSLLVSEEKKKLETQLKEQVNLNEETRLELANLKSSLEDIEVNTLNHLIHEHEQLLNEVSQMDAFLSDNFSVKFRKEMKRLATENLELKNQLSLMNEQFEINKKQLHHASLELEELKSSFNKGDQVLSQLENQRKAQSERHRIELEELRIEMRNFTITQKAEKENLLDLLDSTRNQLNSCQHKMEQIQIERGDVQKELHFLRKRNSELESQLLHSESDRQRLVSELTNLNCTLDQLRDDLETKNEENRKIVEQSRSSIQSLQTKLYRDQQIYQKSDYDWNQKVKQLNELVLQTESHLSDYKKKYKEEHSAISNDLILKQQQVESLQNDLQRLKQEGMSNVAQHKKELEMREQDIQKIKREKQQLEHSLVQKEREKDSFKLRLEMVERELSRLKTQHNVK